MGTKMPDASKAEMLPPLVAGARGLQEFVNGVAKNPPTTAEPTPVIKSTVEIPMPTTVQRMTTFLTGKSIPADAKVSVGVKPGSTRARDSHTLQISWES